MAAGRKSPLYGRPSSRACRCAGPEKLSCPAAIAPAVGGVSEINSDAPRGLLFICLRPIGSARRQKTNGGGLIYRPGDRLNCPKSGCYRGGGGGCRLLAARMNLRIIRAAGRHLLLLLFSDKSRHFRNPDAAASILFSNEVIANYVFFARSGNHKALLNPFRMMFFLK